MTPWKFFVRSLLVIGVLAFIAGGIYLSETISAASWATRRANERVHFDAAIEKARQEGIEQGTKAENERIWNLLGKSKPTPIPATRVTAETRPCKSVSPSIELADGTVLKQNPSTYADVLAKTQAAIARVEEKRKALPVIKEYPSCNECCCDSCKCNPCQCGAKRVKPVPKTMPPAAD